ncbi:hypothetical protein CEXT_524561 [Caerostris extrusa]|uniref:Uncharacterized protein n=1 Tax=Caerostris extrusa TaxID=172846 RepID=A0AAV4RHC1_CAEEX|nr:hypothetical protein CEXT_524561 [Caerostris extrusa]
MELLDIFVGKASFLHFRANWKGNWVSKSLPPPPSCFPLFHFLLSPPYLLKPINVKGLKKGCWSQTIRFSPMVFGFGLRRQSHANWMTVIWLFNGFW